MVLEGMMVGFALLVEWSLREEGRTQPPVPPDQRRAVRVRNLRATVVYLPVIGAAFINPLLALGLSGAIGVYYSFEQTPWLRAKGRVNARPGEPGDARRQRVGVLMGQIRGLQDEYAEDIFRLATDTARRLADDNLALRAKLQVSRSND
jgi:hypothetical protein